MLSRSKQQLRPSMSPPPFCMDCRVKPGNDDNNKILRATRAPNPLPYGEGRAASARSAWRRGVGVEKPDHVRARGCVTSRPPPLTPPRKGEGNCKQTTSFSRCGSIRALRERRSRRGPQGRERSADRRIQPCTAPHIRMLPAEYARARKRADRSALAFRRSAAALATTSTGSAPDPRFLRPGLAGVTRVRLSRVYRAPRDLFAQSLAGCGGNLGWLHDNRPLLIQK